MLGHLGGLEHDEDPESFLAAFETLADVDQAQRLNEGQKELLERGLRETADRRLEEEASGARERTSIFYLKAGWINRRQILAAVLRARPWEFPLRLSRLTTAAASAMLIGYTTLIGSPAVN